MKKLFFSLGLSLLFLTSIGMLKPASVQAAAESGSAARLSLRAVPGPKPNEITVFWNNTQPVDNYHLVYGTDSKNLKYGVLNIGTDKIYTVKKLAPGTRYYFALVPVEGNQALYTSEWVSAVTFGGTVAVPQKPAAKIALVTPVVVKPPTPAVPVVSKPQSSVVTTFVSGPVGKHALTAASGPRAGEVVLSWKNVEDANNYHLVYGTQPGKYQYGVLNIGWVNKYTVKALVPGVRYYFALVPVKNNTALYTTQEVAITAYQPVAIVETTKEAVMMVQPSTSSGLPSTSAGQ